MQQNNTQPESPWLTEAAVAAEAGVTVRTVKTWIADGVLAAHYIGPRVVRVHRDDLRAAFRPARTSA